MQPTLFGPTDATQAGKKQKIRIPRRCSNLDDDEPIQTLFGLLETKAQARRRARRIVRLLGAIEDAPKAIQCCQYHVDILEYFIQRSLSMQLDANDRDGLQRLIGDTEEVLTREDCDAMVSNPKIWRPVPAGWPADAGATCMLRPCIRRRSIICVKCRTICARNGLQLRPARKIARLNW